MPPTTSEAVKYDSMLKFIKNIKDSSKTDEEKPEFLDITTDSNDAEGISIISNSEFEEPVEVLEYKKPVYHEVKQLRASIHEEKPIVKKAEFFKDIKALEPQAQIVKHSNVNENNVDLSYFKSQIENLTKTLNEFINQYRSDKKESEKTLNELKSLLHAF